MENIAAVILCAGKGSRMNDDSKNKVCFDCAGVPVIRRIIDNMKSAGVNRFVVVIGHQAYSVMDCLDGVEGVVCTHYVLGIVNLGSYWSHNCYHGR